MITAFLKMAWPYLVALLVLGGGVSYVRAQYREISELRTLVAVGKTIRAEEVKLAEVRAESEKAQASAKAAITSLHDTQKNLAAKRAELDKVTRKILDAKVKKMDGAELSKAFTDKGYPNAVVQKGAK